MSLSVQERAEYVATFRFIQVFLMETLARWVPQTPEMEVKVLFGRHIWELAQQADGLGKRGYELRAPLQFSLRPLDSYVDVLEEFARTETTPKKIHGFYDVILPGLAARYRNYLERTDHLLDEPTVRVLEKILGEFNRMIGESEALRKELPQVRLTDKEWPARLAKRESREANIVVRRSSAAVA
ncbi:MAG TPA: hypothetical protein VE778_01665 [Candidatus Bathyarchaeia archaeon]|jgi:hypothetical protein|nr:hypothetical protein [Candidatus Bathyarchaeia archaeon]